MLRQVIEERAKRTNLAFEMHLRPILRREELDRTETSFAGDVRLTQKQFEEHMKHADEVAKKWL